MTTRTPALAPLFRVALVLAGCLAVASPAEAYLDPGTGSMPLSAVIGVAAALFFLLFYTFPAGVVLYWTSTNAFQLLSQEATRWWRRTAA